MNDALIALGGVPVNLDRERIVFFDHIADFALEQEYGEAYLAALFSSKVVNADEIAKNPEVRPRYTPVLKDPKALAYFLWTGLRVDAESHGETLTLPQVTAWLMPSTRPRIFNAVLLAITRNIHTPPLPGKALAATASPAAAAKKAGSRTVSTGRKRSARRSRN